MLHFSSSDALTSNLLKRDQLLTMQRPPPTGIVLHELYWCTVSSPSTGIVLHGAQSVRPRQEQLSPCRGRTLHRCSPSTGTVQHGSAPLSSEKGTTKGPSWGYPVLVLGAISSFLSTFGENRQRFLKNLSKLTFEYPPEGPCVA